LHTAASARSVLRAARA